MTASPDDSLTLYPGKQKWLGVLVISTLFVLTAVFLITDEPLTLRAMVGGFFGLGVPLSLLQLFGTSSWLRLEETGFEYAQFGRKFRYDWANVSEFGLWKMKQGLLTTSSHVGFSTEANSAKLLGKINNALVGASGTLPDTYGMSAEKLAELMNTWREKALTRS